MIHIIHQFLIRVLSTMVMISFLLHIISTDGFIDRRLRYEDHYNCGVPPSFSARMTHGV